MKIVIHSVIVLLMDDIIVKVNYSPVCWGELPNDPSGSPNSPLTTTVLEV